MMVTKIASAACVAALTACAAPAENQHETQSSETSWPGIEWGTQVKGQFIKFAADGKVSGNGGCNRFSGTYVSNGNKLNIGPLRATKMACQNLLEEQAFFNKLEQTRYTKTSYLTLALKGENGAVLIVLRRRDWD